MASIKTNKNQTPFWKTNFSWLETLSLGPKRYLQSKGPKMQFVFDWDWECQAMQIWPCSIFLSLSQRQIAFLGPLAWRYHFRPKDKVVSHNKLVFRSVLWFLFLFVLMDTILLNLDLQNRTMLGSQFSFFPHFCL